MSNDGIFDIPEEVASTLRHQMPVSLWQRLLQATYAELNPGYTTSGGTPRDKTKTRRRDDMLRREIIAEIIDRDFGNGRPASFYTMKAREQLHDAGYLTGGAPYEIVPGRHIAVQTATMLKRAQ